MTVSTSKICPHCGATVPALAPFCPHCGRPQPIAKVNQSAPSEDRTAVTSGPTEGTPPSGPPDDSASTTQPKWSIGRAVGGCLLAFACVVLVFLGIGAVAVYQGLNERAALTRQQASVHYERGLAHMQADEYELAIAEFEHTLRLDPTHRGARDALRDAKTTALAQPTPTSATLYEATAAILDEAKALARERQWPEAIQRLEQLRGLAPDFETAQVADLLYTANFNLGKQLVSEDRVNEAIHAFEQALLERPGEPEASRELDLASLYASAQTTWGSDWPSTIDFMEQLYTLDPNYWDVGEKLYQAYEAYGDTLTGEGAWCLAERQYEQASLLKPGAAIQRKWDEAVRLCRTPTGTPTPRKTPSPALTATATITANVSPTRATSSASGSILFSRYSLEGEQWEIVATTPAGNLPVVVLEDATQPAASRNGNLLAYHAELDESEGLHVFNVPTAEDVRITTFREDVTPDWAPDNLRLVFPSQRAGDRRWQVYIGWADGKSEPVALVDGRTPAWSPSGTLIAYQGTDAQGNNPGLYLIGADGGPVLRLTQGESDRAPAWSPACAMENLSIADGRLMPSTGSSTSGDCQLAFMSSRDGNWEIYLTAVPGGTVRRLTNSAGNDGLPTWSPDGKHIAFVSDRQGSWGVYIMPATGGEAVKIADWGEDHPDWLVERISWVR